MGKGFLDRRVDTFSGRAVQKRSSLNELHKKAEFLLISYISLSETHTERETWVSMDRPMSRSKVGFMVWNLRICLTNCYQRPIKTQTTEIAWVVQ